MFSTLLLIFGPKNVDVDSLNFVHFFCKIFPDMYLEQWHSMKFY